MPIRLLLIAYAVLLLLGNPAAQPMKLVVLGASTAAGKNLPENGESPADSWVNRYAAYLSVQKPGSTVVNLAVSGYNSYHGLPTGSVAPAGRPAADTARNITAAIALRPDAIITNYVGDGGFGNDEVLTNLAVIAAAAGKAGIPLWMATTQPSINGQTPAVIAVKLDQRDRVLARFASQAIDFWTPLADTNGSGLAARSLIQLYDDNHPNAEGHRRLFEQVVAAGVSRVPSTLRRRRSARIRTFPGRSWNGSRVFFWNECWSNLNGSAPSRFEAPGRFPWVDE